MDGKIYENYTRRTIPKRSMDPKLRRKMKQLNSPKPRKRVESPLLKAWNIDLCYGNHRFLYRKWSSSCKNGPFKLFLYSILSGFCISRALKSEVKHHAEAHPESLVVPDSRKDPIKRFSYKIPTANKVIIKNYAKRMRVSRQSLCCSIFVLACFNETFLLDCLKESGYLGKPKTPQK